MEEQVKLARLTGVRLVNFKSFVDEAVTMAAPLTLLVGGNASGKSNLLDALRFLHGLSRSLSVLEVLNGASEVGRTGWPGLRGGTQETARPRETSFTIETQWRLESEVDLVYSVTCSVHPELEVAKESLTVVGENEPLFSRGDRVEGGPPDWRKETDPPLRWVALRPAPSETGRTSAVHMAERSSLSRLESSRFGDQRIVPYARAVRDALGRIDFLDLNPGKMRAFASRKVKRMNDDGENLSAAVYHLDKRGEGQLLIDWLSELCAPKIEKIDFIVVEDLDEVMLRLMEPEGFGVSARSLSDGTLRFLGLLVALLTARPGEMLLLEEVGTGLHPTRAGLLVELLATAAAERGCQIIATTHSPQVLQALQNLSGGIRSGGLDENGGWQSLESGLTG